MTNFIYILLGVYGLSILMFLCIVAGEKYTKSQPDSKFASWWRKNVVGDYEEN